MEDKGKILIIDDNEDVLFALNLLLEPYMEKIKVTTQPGRIEFFMKSFHPDVILLDMNFRRDAISGQEGFDCLEQILAIDPQAVVIFMTAYADTDKAVRAIKAGATDFVSKPWEKDKLLATLSSAVKLSRSRREVGRLQQQVQVLQGGDELPELIGRSPAMMQVKETIDKLSDTDANILVLGENGTGKDLVARMLKFYSPRSQSAFVTIDLGSIPEQLFESELFGYEKGAFTDARKSKPGRMEVASGGTLFLDEIGNLSLPMQAKLLTAIEKRCITRLGAVEPISIDVRLICATNADLRQRVEEGAFRQDLLYRINTIELSIPPLRERGEDILLLSEHFLTLYNRKYQKEIRGMTREAKQKLMKYAWPGNVRELQHTLERAVILADHPLLRPDDFFFPNSKKTVEEPIGDELNLEKVERKVIERALRVSGGNMTRAAELLGITRFALYRKLEKLGL
ncbi:sigma-54 dependent transcriptional regulator [uncultured Bacteroides sp.]|uniref:sigma-54-dependent transcriptional regulator n=1 Tax=uncultured Bacteroides sp. TaxID=162156 RepID=UPI002601948D|nr:sigma-54 dependent transcriptional regulator [uncultured Bacteroides sp.]